MKMGCCAPSEHELPAWYVRPRFRRCLLRALPSSWVCLVSTGGSVSEPSVILASTLTSGTEARPAPRRAAAEPGPAEAAGHLRRPFCRLGGRTGGSRRRLVSYYQKDSPSARGPGPPRRE